MRRHLFLLLVSLAACKRPPAANDAPPPRGASAPADASVDAAVFRGPHATDTTFAWAFWTSSGTLVAASKTDLFALEPACAPPRRVPLAIDALVADNGADAFVVEHGGAFELWNAATMAKVAPVDHPAKGRGGAVSRERIALGGCKEIAPDPNLVTSCGEIYDAKTGAHTAGFVAKHGFSGVAFTPDGKYLVARGDSRGLTVFDASSGKVVVARLDWSALREVHAWNRPDVASIAGDDLVVSHGDIVEHVDLATGKTLGKLVTPGQTLAVHGPRTKRVVAFQGDSARARVWDVATHKVVRTFELAKHVAAGATCTHCALEIDEVDEDRVWLTSAYTNDRLELRIGSGEVKRVEAHDLRSESVPSPTHRVEETYVRKSPQAHCSLDRRDRDAPSVAIPVEYCNRSDAPRDWPYPGFDASGRFLASLRKGTVRIWDVEREDTVCTAGR